MEEWGMTYVIAEPCVGVKDGSCVDVCPVECIHSATNVDMYFIDPDECIDCGVCVPECPVDAIYPEEELPDRWARFTGINTGFFGPDDGSSGAPVPRGGVPPTLPGGTEATTAQDEGNLNL
jgi:NAD-dependent dihydropyrimidine dehydrogenase PreA subunit